MPYSSDRWCSHILLQQECKYYHGSIARLSASICVDHMCKCLIPILTIILQTEKQITFDEGSIIMKVVEPYNLSYRLLQYDVKYTGTNLLNLNLP